MSILQVLRANVLYALGVTYIIAGLIIMPTISVQSGTVLIVAGAVGMVIKWTLSRIERRLERQ